MNQFLEKLGQQYWELNSKDKLSTNGKRPRKTLLCYALALVIFIYMLNGFSSSLSLLVVEFANQWVVKDPTSSSGHFHSLADPFRPNFHSFSGFYWSGNIFIICFLLLATPPQGYCNLVQPMQIAMILYLVNANWPFIRHITISQRHNQYI